MGREHRALRVDRLYDPIATRHFHRAIDHLTAGGLHFLGSLVHVLDVHITQPVRLGPLFMVIMPPNGTSPTP